MVPITIVSCIRLAKIFDKFLNGVTPSINNADIYLTHLYASQFGDCNRLEGSAMLSSQIFTNLSAGVTLSRCRRYAIYINC